MADMTKAELQTELEKVRAEFDKFKELAATDPKSGLANEFLSRIELAEIGKAEAVERANSLAIELGNLEARYNDLRSGFEKYRQDSETLRIV